MTISVQWSAIEKIQKKKKTHMKKGVEHNDFSLYSTPAAKAFKPVKWQREDRLQFC